MTVADVDLLSKPPTARINKAWRRDGQNQFYVGPTKTGAGKRTIGLNPALAITGATSDQAAAHRDPFHGPPGHGELIQTDRRVLVWFLNILQCGGHDISSYRLRQVAEVSVDQPASIQKGSSNHPLDCPSPDRCCRPLAGWPACRL